jgi:hypothetical protein
VVKTKNSLGYTRRFAGIAHKRAPEALQINKKFEPLRICSTKPSKARKYTQITSVLQLVDFSGFFVLPVPSQLQREVEFDGPGTGTIVGAAAAIPAFFRM